MSEESVLTLKINMAEINTDLKYIKKSLEDHMEREEEHIQKIYDSIDKFFTTADGKYASKRVETAFWGGLGVLGTSLMVWAVNILLSHGSL